MGYHPRIETPDMGSFLTTRTRGSELWFVNNPALEQGILGRAAKYSTLYQAKLYAFAIEGDHIHGAADFPNSNRSAFMRDLNSTIACAVPRFVPEFPGGHLWGRRYSTEILPAADDIEERFFYAALQAVQDGLVEKISDYPGYNFFHDAIWGIERKYEVLRRGEYNAAKRYNSKIRRKDYTDVFTLKYARLPGYEHLTQKQYARLMQKKLEQRRVAIVAERKAKGLGFAGREALLAVRPGAKPRHTKTSTRFDYRPRVLAVCMERLAAVKSWYFGMQSQYKEASARYRAGELNVQFPPGMYLPPAVCCTKAPP